MPDQDPAATGNAPRADAAAPRKEPPVVDSGTLLQGAGELRIEHDGSVYTLRLTRQNKLILTK
ncbi:MAG: hemin uptake protein HemP [Pseudomonadota bacterium]